MYLEDIVTPGIVLIARDFTSHVDCQSDTDARSFAEILQTYGRKQLFHGPIQVAGHTPDLIITRSNNDINVFPPKSSMALCDHFFIECNLDICQP